MTEKRFRCHRILYRRCAKRRDNVPPYVYYRRCVYINTTTPDEYPPGCKHFGCAFSPATTTIQHQRRTCGIIITTAVNAFDNDTTNKIINDYLYIYMYSGQWYTI